MKPGFDEKVFVETSFEQLEKCYMYINITLNVLLLENAYGIHWTDRVTNQEVLEYANFLREKILDYANTSLSLVFEMCLKILILF